MPDLRFSVGDGREFLAKHDLLGHLTPEELDRLLAPARVERPDAGRVLFRQGHPRHRPYVRIASSTNRGKRAAVSEGWVRVSTKTSYDRPVMASTYFG